MKVDKQGTSQEAYRQYTYENHALRVNHFIHISLHYMHLHYMQETSEVNRKHELLSVINR